MMQVNRVFSPDFSACTIPVCGIRGKQLNFVSAILYSQHGKKHAGIRNGVVA